MSGEQLFSFTFYPSVASTSGTLMERTWPEWARVFSEHQERKSKDGPCLVLGSVWNTRRDAAVKEIHALGLDVEHRKAEEIEACFARLAALGLAYVWHTTFSHDPAAPEAHRLRILIPLSRPVPAAEWRATWARAQAAFGNVSDPKTCNPSRVFYLPACKPGAHRDAAIAEGAFLDPDTLPAISVPALSGIPDESADEASMRLALVAGALSADRRHPDWKMWRAVVDGRPFAEDGKRHGAMLKLTMRLASRTRGRPLPGEAIAALFAPSCDAMRALKPDRPGAEMAASMYLGAVARLAKNAAGGAEPYGADDLARIAEAQGCDPSELEHRWLVKLGEALWVLCEDGDYRPIELRNAAFADKWLARAPILRTVPSGDSARRATAAEQVAANGAVADPRVSLIDLAASRSRLMSDRIFVEATCPLRVEALGGPAGHEGVARWLGDLAGDAYSVLADWIACVPDLRRMLCALMLLGPRGAGKTLLARGLAALWSESSTAASGASAFGNFNAAMTRCPLVLCDEQMPSQGPGQDSTQVLRSLIGTESREATRKYHEAVECRGNLRLIITGNHNILSRKGLKNKDDAEAVAQRILSIQARPEAARLLDALDAATKREWAATAIARHALWLAETRSVSPGPRFWVEGNTRGGLVEKILSETAIGAAACEVIMTTLSDGDLAARAGGHILVGDGKLLVNAEGLKTRWHACLGDHPSVAWDRGRVNEYLAGISNGRVRHRLPDGRAPRYHEIKADEILRRAEEQMIGDGDRVRAMLAGPLVGDRPGAARVVPMRGTP